MLSLALIALATLFTQRATMQLLGTEPLALERFQPSKKREWLLKTRIPQAGDSEPARGGWLAALGLRPRSTYPRSWPGPHWGVADSVAYEKKFGRKDRVYCMVPSLHSAEAESRWRAILSTWGPRCDVIKFFVDPPSADEPPVPATVSNGIVTADIVQLDMVRPHGICDGRPCRHIWEKVWRSWVWVSQHDLDKAEWFLKVDDDTYFVPTNFRKFVRYMNWSPDDPLYFGHLLHIGKRPWHFISGVCTAFSHEAIRRLGPRLLDMKHEYGPRKGFPHSHGTCVDRDGATEELVTSKCLQEVGVNATAALESGVKETVLALGLPMSLRARRKGTRNKWYWQGKPETRAEEEEGMSRRFAWGIHGFKGDGENMLGIEHSLLHQPRYELADFAAADGNRGKRSPKHDKAATARFILGMRDFLHEDD